MPDRSEPPNEPEAVVGSQQAGSAERAQTSEQKAQAPENTPTSEAADADGDEAAGAANDEPTEAEGLVEPDPDRRRGPRALAVAFESLALTSTGGIIDGLTSGELGLWFAVGFVAASVLTAVAVRIEDLLVAVILPPLVFAASVVLTSPAVPGGSGGGVKRQLVELGTTLALEAPLLVATTAAAGLVALWRWRRYRRSAVPDATSSSEAAQDTSDA